MTTNETELPWGTLRATTGELPWAELERFAEAVAESSSVTEDLKRLYDESWEAASDTLTYAYLYVPAVFALAGPRLSHERKSELAAFLVRQMVKAGREDDDLSLEVLQSACGSLGPVCVPAVLDALAGETDPAGAWFHLWGLTVLAAQADDGTLRDRVIEVSTKALQRVERRGRHPIVGIGAIWALARLGATESRPLLAGLVERADQDMRPELQAALDRLDGKVTDLERGPWDMPVREWFTPQWETARGWFEKDDDGDEHEDWDDDEEGAERRADDLARRFEQSPFAAALPEKCGKCAGWIVFNVFHYARAYTDAEPEDLDLGVLREVLLEVFPRKVSAERDTFECVAPVTQALLRWLESEGILEDSAKLADAVGTWAEKIVANAMDPNNWGIAKSFVMGARADGVDLTDREAMDDYMVKFNRRFEEQQEQRPRTYHDEPEPAEITAPAAGRNDPCPCGSGKKYKNCCGAK